MGKRLCLRVISCLGTSIYKNNEVKEVEYSQTSLFLLALLPRHVVYYIDPREPISVFPIR